MQALEHPLATVREGAVRELKRFLIGSDAGLAKAARTAAEQARDDDSRRVASAAAEILAAVALERAEPVPLPTPTPEPQPVPTPESGEKSSTAPPQIPSIEDSPRTPYTSRKDPLLWVLWIILGVIVLIVIVALVSSKTTTRNDGKVETQPAVSANTPKQPYQAQALLTEAKSWPLIVADSFDSGEASSSIESADINIEDKYGIQAGRISSGVLVFKGENATGC